MRERKYRRKTRRDERWRAADGRTVFLPRYYSSGFVRRKVFIESRYLGGRAEVLSQFFSISSSSNYQVSRFPPGDLFRVFRALSSPPSFSLSISSYFRFSKRFQELFAREREGSLSADEKCAEYISRADLVESFVIPKLSTTWQLSSISSFNCSTLLHGPFFLADRLHWFKRCTLNVKTV